MNWLDRLRVYLLWPKASLFAKELFRDLRDHPERWAYDGRHLSRDKGGFYVKWDDGTISNCDNDLIEEDDTVDSSLIFLIANPLGKKLAIIDEKREKDDRKDYRARTADDRLARQYAVLDHLSENS